jgi:hypothetical protein
MKLDCSPTILEELSANSFGHSRLAGPRWSLEDNEPPLSQKLVDGSGCDSREHGVAKGYEEVVELGSARSTNLPVSFERIKIKERLHDGSRGSWICVAADPCCAVDHAAVPLEDCAARRKQATRCFGNVHVDCRWIWLGPRRYAEVTQMTTKSRHASPVTVSGQQSLVRCQAAGAHDEGHEATAGSREPSDAGTTVRARRRILLCNYSRPRDSVVIREAIGVPETVFRSMP